MNLFSFLKEVKSVLLYAVEHGIAMEPMMGKWASSRVDMGYTELFCIPEVTSVFNSSCDCVLGDSLVFHQEKQGILCVDWEYGIALQAMQQNRASYRGEGEVSWFYSCFGGNLGYILELLQG